MLLGAGLAQDCAPPGPGGQPPALLESLTPNGFLARGTPTFVVGTAGDEREDRLLRSQARFLRDLLFPEAEIMADTDLDATRGPGAWPPNAVLYGGAHVNHVVAALSPHLPVTVEAGLVVLGDHRLRGGDKGLLAIMPARAAVPAVPAMLAGSGDPGETDETGVADGKDQAPESGAAPCPGWPDFLLYAGSGSPGVVDINGITHGRDGYLLVDRCGPLMAGAWHREGDGQLLPVERIASRRIPWRERRRGLFGRLESGESSVRAATIRVLWPRVIPEQENDDAVTDTVLGALEAVVRRLSISDPWPVWVHIHPDVRSKLSLTTVGGDGHALGGLGAVHVMNYPAGPGGPLDLLVRHEGTHVLVAAAWGAAGSAAWGEGLAVWVAGAYGGRPLESWRGEVKGELPALVEFLGRGFHSLPEQASYPLAGALVSTIVEEHGLAALRRHFYGATARTIGAACAAAGTTLGELERAWHSLVRG